MSISFNGPLPAQFELINLSELQGLVFNALKPQDVNAVTRSVNVPDSTCFSLILYGKYSDVRFAVKSAHPTGLLVQRLATTNVAPGSYLDVTDEGIVLDLGRLILSLRLALPDDRARAVRAIATLLSDRPHVPMRLLVEGPDDNITIHQFIQGPFIIVNLELNDKALAELAESTLIFSDVLSVKADGHACMASTQIQLRTRFKSFLRVNCEAGAAAEHMSYRRSRAHCYLTWHRPT